MDTCQILWINFKTRAYARGHTCTHMNKWKYEKKRLQHLRSQAGGKNIIYHNINWYLYILSLKLKLTVNG